METRTKGKIAFVIIILLILGGALFIFKGCSMLKMKDYHSKAIYVMDRDGKKKMGKNENQKLAPASLTKLVTALTAKDRVTNMEKTVPVDVDFYKKMVKINSSMAGFYGKEYVTYRDLFAGLLLASGGECAGTLAVSTYGSVDDFVIAMNEKAASLGCKNTHFTNPDGSDDENQYSTARDMAIILRAVFDDPELGHIITQRDYRSISSLDHPQGVLIESTVLKEVDNEEIPEGSVVGGKSGTTENAGLCWATILRKKDKLYFSVTMGAPFEDLKNHELLQKEDTLRILNAL